MWILDDVVEMARGITTKGDSGGNAARGRLEGKEHDAEDDEPNEDDPENEAQHDEPDEDDEVPESRQYMSRDGDEWYVHDGKGGVRAKCKSKAEALKKAGEMHESCKQRGLYIARLDDEAADNGWHYRDMKQMILADVRAFGQEMEERFDAFLTY